MINSSSHVAFSDESYITRSRYRSIAVVSLAVKHEEEINTNIARINLDSGIKEFKWTKLRQARDRFAAIKLVDLSIECALKKTLRIDILIWDTQDSRHDVQARDDIQNLQRMYFHIFKNILFHRWPRGSTWRLHPDENSALNWNSLHSYLTKAASYRKKIDDFLEEDDLFRWLVVVFSVVEIKEACSTGAHLCQLADLFAGLGAYSHSAYAKYKQWEISEKGQLPFDLFDGESNQTESLSNRDREGCRVMHHFDKKCKRHKLGVGLESSCGFKTYLPDNPINFWLYQPQSGEDKAPSREK
jgi:hypothetical protein